MQASRISTRALKHIAAGSKQTRNLHMTGPATFSNLLTSERPAMNPPRDLASLRAECSKLKLPTTGSKAELIDRLSAHELSGTRAFSTGIQDSKRPSTPSTETPSFVRHFNTSRTLKKPKDTSTIDFAYYPDFDPDIEATPVIRVPLLETATPLSQAAALEVDDPIVLPRIFTAAADGTHIYAPSFMSEVTDNNTIDFQGLASNLRQRFTSATSSSRSSSGAEQGEGMVRQVWTGLVDDVLGPKHVAH